MKTAGSLVVGIAGPTGIGKSEVAVRLAKLLDGELVSCDSVQVFKHINIGANKYIPKYNDPPQHLVDILEPTADFSAGDFVKKCMDCIINIISRQKVPILVGGTGFYFDWIINGIPSAPVVSDINISKINSLVKADGSWESSLERLKKVDPEYAEGLLKNDYYRLVKAVAFYHEHGYPLSTCPRLVSPVMSGAKIDWRCIYLTTDREIICRNIDERCELMIRQGLIQETQSLIQEGLLLKDSIAGRSIGYKETIDFLESISEPNSDAHHCFIKYLGDFSGATRQYARKQDTWFANKFKGQFIWMDKSYGIDYIVDDIYKYCTSDDRVPWQELSDQLKLEMRSLAEKENRRKRMRTYKPQFPYFSDPLNIQNTLSTLNK
jgi:tRNA dimethylallyltransferase